MKLIYFTVIGLLLMQCTNTNKENNSIDSTINKQDSSTTLLRRNSSTLQSGSSKDSLATSIENKIQELSSITQSKLSDYYTITTNYTGYEAGSRYTWYFDKSFHLTYCKGNWDAESFGGTNLYYFENDHLLAALTEEFEQEEGKTTVIHKGFKPVYGYVTSSEQKESITYLDETGYTAADTAARKQFSDLMKLLRENTGMAVIKDNEVSIHIENKVNYGTEFTEEENYSMSKTLFEAVIKKQ